MEGQFLNNLGSGVAANTIFVIAYLVSILLKKRCKHSECRSGCFSCSSDMQNTMRGEENDDIV